jgi:HTH-type transcriptional regulator/antitoxin HigA
MIRKNTEFSPDWVSPPGNTICDLLEERGWTKIELARRLGQSEKHVNLLLSGRAGLTEDTAIRLERVLGSTAHFWLSREAQYREAVARQEMNDELQKSISWLSNFPLREMRERGFITRNDKSQETVAEMLTFFAVASVSAWKTEYNLPNYAFRASQNVIKHSAPVGAWLRQGERLATKIETKDFDAKLFKGFLKHARSLTFKKNPSDFIERLTGDCAKCGVAVVVLSTLPGCPVSGCMRWLSPKKVLLMLSDRFKTNDHFWFTFFHEAGHVLLHGSKQTYFEEYDGQRNQIEDEANNFAANMLIPPSSVRELHRIEHSKGAIVDFATRIGIDPGIVVGRLQHDGVVPWKSHLNSLKRVYRW